ncbi:MAG TPA: hypothetical protein VGF00_04520 [Acidimicrobiia bacterium]
MTVLAILGVAVVLLGAVALLFLPDRPGGEFVLKGVTVKSPAAGLPLILAGLVAVGFGSGVVSDNGSVRHASDASGIEAATTATAATTRTTTAPPTTPPSLRFPDVSMPIAHGEPTLVLSKSSGPPGTTLTVSGTGFSPTETVEIDFSAKQVGKAVADRNGGFSAVAITIPADWVFKGQVSITASGRSSVRWVKEPFDVK